MDIAKVETNRCGCHPETCCCQDAVLLINGIRAVTGEHDVLRQIARELNQIAPLTAEVAALRRTLAAVEQRTQCTSYGMGNDIAQIIDAARQEATHADK